MKIGFYSKIATDNIKKNPRLYIPRILSEAGLLGCFYIMFALTIDDRLADVIGGAYLSTLMGMGAVILGILSAVMILYINSFLMKQRKSEYGLYNVLGMEKGHIIKVLFCESFYTFAIAAAAGIGFGILFYKLSSLFICSLIHIEAIAGFYYINAGTVIFPILIFICFDFVAFAVNSISVLRLKPVQLLAGRNTGEKEPKIKWVMLIIGGVSLGIGYYIALTVQSPLEALNLFFLAVLLVIIGTYFLFITGTIFVLKCLKKNKKYYYNKKHMPAVSGLLYRMKQNAVGLASIAVLATGVLVMISTSVSLYAGVEDTINVNYPQHVYMSAYKRDGDMVEHLSADELERVAREVADEYGLEIENVQTEKFLGVSYLNRDSKLLKRTEVSGGWDTDEVTSVVYITEDTYNELNGKKISSEGRKKYDLNKDEIVFCRISSTVDKMGDTFDSLTIDGNEYKIKDTITYFPIQNYNSTVVSAFGIVVADEEVLDNIYRAQKESYGDYASEYTDRIAVTFADEEAASEVGEQMDQSIRDKFEEGYLYNYDLFYDSKWSSKANVLAMYGSFLFLGIILGFVCMFSTILIIYYKQISEGYEDRDRFQIMQKIGMESSEVKKTIRSQLVLQFFLPLITAGVHTAVMFPILLKLLQILMLTNTTLFIVCTIITFVIFAVIYAIVYLLTSKTYYRIVH